MRRAGKSRRAAAAALLLAALLSIAGTSAASESPPATPTAQPVIGLPVRGPTLIGSSPAESVGETWGYSNGAGFQIVRYTPTAGWQIQPAPLNAKGEALGGFTPAPGPLAGSVTPDGGVAIVGEDEAKLGQVLVRDPNGSFQETPTLTTESTQAGAPGEPKSTGEQPEPNPAKGAGESSESIKGAGEAGEPEPNALLRPGETLFATSGEGGVLMAAVDQPSGRTGVFLVPFENPTTHAPEDVLSYDGAERRWTREPICVGISSTPEPGEPCAKPGEGFKVLAIDAKLIAERMAARAGRIFE